MPLILYSYLATEILAPFAAGLLILSGVIFTVKLMQVVDLIFSFNIGMADFVRLCAYLSPNLLVFSIPMASTMAVIIGFTRLTTDNEIIAMKAAGISLRQMLPPVVVFGLITTMITGYCSIRLIPASSSAMNNLFAKLAVEKITQGVQAKRFSENTGDLVIFVQEVDETGKEWQGVYLSDLRDQENPVTALARTGSLSPNLSDMAITLDLHNGTLHRNNGEASQTISFARYQITIPVAAPDSMGSNPKVSKKNLHQKELQQYAAEYGLESKKGISFMIEYHRRLVMSAGCLIMSLLGVPLALRVKTGKRNLGVYLGLGFFLLYYVAISAVKGMCYNTSLPIAFVMWLPNITFGLMTIIALLITSQEKWPTIFKMTAKKFRPTPP